MKPALKTTKSDFLQDAELILRSIGILTYQLS